MWITRQPRPKYPLQKSNPRKNKLLRTLENYIIGHDKDITSILLHLWRDQMIVTGYKQIREWVNHRDVTDEDVKDFKGDYQRLAERQLRPIWERTMQDAVSPDNPQFDWAKKFTREEQKHPENPLGGHDDNAFHPTSEPDSSGPSPTTEGSGNLKPFFPTFDFHPQKDGVRLWSQQHTAEFVKDATDEQRKAIKAVISQCTEKKFSVEETARNIRSTIGLNSRQAAANTKYYNRVKEQLAKDHPKMKPENIEKKARKKADAYAKDQLNYRARMIARTEIGNAYNAGAIYGVKQAIDQGLIASATKIWVASKNEANMCPGCSKLDGVEIPLDDQFDFNGDKIDAPLAHPNGKCTLEFHVEEPDFNVMEMGEDPIFLEGEAIDTIGLPNEKGMERRLPESDDNFITFNNGNKDVIRPKNIRNNLKKTEVGQETLQYLQENNAQVKLYYNVDNPSKLSGEYTEADGISIFCDKTKTVQNTAEAIVHETWHMVLNSDHPSQYEEIECFKREEMHRSNSKELTEEQLAHIIKTVKALYSELPEK